MGIGRRRRLGSSVPTAVIRSRWWGGCASLNNYRRGRAGHYCA